MTLRDFFAAWAMQGLLSQHSKTLAGTMQAVFTCSEIVSREAYEIADAMIAQREIA